MGAQSQEPISSKEKKRHERMERHKAASIRKEMITNTQHKLVLTQLQCLQLHIATEFGVEEDEVGIVDTDLILLALHERIGVPCEIEMMLGGIVRKICIDSGAGVNAISVNIVEKTALKHDIRAKEPINVTIANGQSESTHRVVCTSTKRGDFEHNIWFVIVKGLPCDAIIGYPSMQHFKITLDNHDETIKLGDIEKIKMDKYYKHYEEGIPLKGPITLPANMVKSNKDQIQRTAILQSMRACAITP